MKLILLCGLGLLLSVPNARAEARPLIAIQPLGPVRAVDVEKVRSGIAALYEVTIEVLPEKPLPKAAWYAPRSRYKADLLLDALEEETPPRFAKVIGLTARDISTEKGAIEDWGIFGLGRLAGRSCVVSTFRLRAGKADEAAFHGRLMKIVNHELGHTFGLVHCATAGCLMQDAGGKIATVDGESGKPCKDCAARLPLVR